MNEDEIIAQQLEALRNDPRLMPTPVGTIVEQPLGTLWICTAAARKPYKRAEEPTPDA